MKRGSVIMMPPVPPPKRAKRAASAAWTARCAALASMDPDQQAAFDLVRDGKSMFLTGAAGCGKTLVVEHLMRHVADAHGADALRVVATTNKVAGALGGATLHAQFGISIMSLTHEDRFARRKRETDAALRAMRVLVVEEVSMVHPQLFEYMDYALRELRDRRRPFGGVQVVLVGDFYQLGPIMERGEPRVYAFETAAWRALAPVCVCLRTNHRQGGGGPFLDALSMLRIGKVDDATWALVRSRTVSPSQRPQLGTVPYLTALRRSASETNERYMASLPGAEVTFLAEDTQILPGAAAALQALTTPERLALKANALVVLLANLDKHSGVVHGATGHVVRFVSATGADIPAEAGGQWMAGNAGCPRVVIRLADGSEVTIEPTVREAIRHNEVVGSRRQMPLAVAAAMTVHAAQGMSLDRVAVDGAEVFDDGHFYVALSRCRTLDGLTIVSADRSKVRADRRVFDFYSKI
jgi:ATP-dependent DNA helicase PIF1